MNIIYNPETSNWEFQTRTWSAFEYNLTQVMNEILQEKEESDYLPKQQEEQEEYDSEDPRGWSDEEAVERGYTEYGDLEAECHVKVMEEEGIPIPNTKERNKLRTDVKPAPKISEEEALNKTDNLQTPTSSSQRRVKKRGSAA